FQASLVVVSQEGIAEVEKHLAFVVTQIRLPRQGSQIFRGRGGFVDGETRLGVIQPQLDRVGGAPLERLLVEAKRETMIAGTCRVVSSDGDGLDLRVPGPATLRAREQDTEQ